MMPGNQEEDLKKIGETVVMMKADLDNLHTALDDIKKANEEIIKLLKVLEAN
jgi:hypothetical protein